MTGSPVFSLHAKVTKNQKIQRKLNFVRHVPEDSFKLHIDNLLTESEKNSETSDVKLTRRRRETGSVSSSFVFDNRRGVKRKLDFDTDDFSDEVSSYKFSGRNISLCGFQSKNSSLADVKSITFTPSKHRVRGSYSRSSVGSTCRRRLFAEFEPDSKRRKLESPVLCQKTKKKEVKLSLKKKFPGVPNSDAARSGLLLNLAFSKYNLSSNKEDVSVDFVDGPITRRISKRDLIQYSSIKNDDSAVSHSPVFKAIKKVKRRLDLEKSASKGDRVSRGENSDSDARFQICSENNTNRLNEGADENLSETGHQPRLMVDDTTKGTCVNKIFAEGENGSENKNDEMCISSPKSTLRDKSAEKCRNDLFRNSKLRPLLRNEIFNLSRPIHIYGAKKSNVAALPIPYQSRLVNHREDTSVMKSLKCTRAESSFDRIIVNRSPLEVRNDLENLSNERCKLMPSKTPKKWFNDSFNKTRSDLRKSLFYRKKDAFLDSHIQRFLKDCVNAIGQEVAYEDCQVEKNVTSSVDTEEARVGCVKNTKSEDPVDQSREQSIIEESSNLIKEKKKISNEPDFVIEEVSQNVPNENFGTIESCFSNDCSAEQYNKEVIKKDDLVFEDVNSQEVSEHCIEEVELVIESPDSFGKHSEGYGHINDSLIEKSQRLRIMDDSVNEDDALIFDETLRQSGQQLSIVLPDFRVEEVSSPESVSFHYPVADTVNSGDTPVKTSTNDPNEPVTFDSTKKRKRKKKDLNNLVMRLERLLGREKSASSMWEYEISKKIAKNENHKTEPAVFRIRKMWQEFSRLILLCSYAEEDRPGEVYELDRVKKFGVDISNSVTIVTEPAYCPKSLTFSSIFQVHPPWLILHSKQDARTIIMRPFKIEIISKDGNPPLYKDPTLPNDSIVLDEKQFCSCDGICNCTLPEGYQTVIEPLLSLNTNFHSFECGPRLKNYDSEYFKSIHSVTDAVLKHRLYSSEHLSLDLRILHVHKTNVGDDFSFWHIVCVDTEQEVCCIAIEGEIKFNFSSVPEDNMFKFVGLLPWKLIPAKYVLQFIEYVEFRDVSDIEDKIGADSLYVFVLSDKYGRIKQLS